MAESNIMSEVCETIGVNEEDLIGVLTLPLWMLSHACLPPIHGEVEKLYEDKLPEGWQLG